MALWCLEFYYFRFRIELRTFNQFSGPFWEVERLKAKQSRAPSKSDTVGSRNGVLAERELGLGNLPTRNTLECVIKCQNKYKFSHNSIYMPAAQLELKHRERMLDSRFGIGDSGFGMRDTVSRARLYRQLQSSPESVGGILPSPSTAPAPGSFFCRLSPAIVYSFYHLIVFAQHFSIGILHCSKAAAQK